MSVEPTEHGCVSPCDCDDFKAQYAAETAQLLKRREELGLDVSGGRRGLALSGGGIRSATFCLGVLQAMARANSPYLKQENSPDESDVGKYLLPHFDYLSTVSGGGYIGAFFCTLFVGSRLRPTKEGSGASAQGSPVESEVVLAAKNAYKVLRWEPPGRIHTHKNYEKSDIGDAPTAWLRENGRYLTPSGAGDVFYGAALALRNWLSVHFVVGMPIVLLMTAMLGLELLTKRWLGLPQIPTLTPSFLRDTLWWLPVIMMLLWLAPCILAFWMVYSATSAEADRPSVYYLGASIALFMVAVMLHCAIVPWMRTIGWSPTELLTQWPDSPTLLAGLTILVVTASLGLSVFEVCWFKGAEHSIKMFRVRITRRLASGIKFTLVVVFLVAADCAVQWAYQKGPGGLSITPAGLLAAAIWGIRTLVSFGNEKNWTARVFNLPLTLLTSIAGGALAFLVVICWGLLIRWFVDTCSGPQFCTDGDVLLRLRNLSVIVLVLIGIGGCSISFINLSSLQSLYSARLARAFLGATNGKRFQPDSDQKIRVKRLSVSEALPGDDLTLDEYYGDNSYAPLHLINITVNLTVDPAERLVQSDRKGLPLCIAPSVKTAKEKEFDKTLSPTNVKGDGTYRFIFDGIPKVRSCTSKYWGRELDQPLTLGHWIATSGAAFTTGLGRQTSAGTSLLLGLSNIRLGTWWPAKFLASYHESPGKPVPVKDHWYLRPFRTQAYLANELMGRFHGHHRDYLYLSDGGHFENTGAYELLRPDRRLRLIVLCDCGADPEFKFGDLANLIRLARLDLGLEIEEDLEFREPEWSSSGLEKVIGRYRHVDKQEEGGSPLSGNQCALLFNVHNSTGDLKCMLLVIKPTLIDRMNGDVWNYAKTHPAFPNEPTVNQFFDEAQFESYRQLGLNSGELLFGCAANTAKPGSTFESVLWRYLGAKFEQMDD